MIVAAVNSIAAAAGVVAVMWMCGTGWLDAGWMKAGTGYTYIALVHTVPSHLQWSVWLLHCKNTVYLTNWYLSNVTL